MTNEKYNKAFHSSHKSQLDLVETLREKTFAALRHSQASLSNVHVASCIYAEHPTGVRDCFTGVNLELTIQTGVHAEVCALFKALSEGYTKLLIVTETSDNIKACKPLCDQCRYYFRAVAPYIHIIVYNPDGDTIFDNPLKSLENETYIPTRLIV